MKKLLFISLFVVLNLVFITGCSNENKIDQMSSDIHSLNVKIEQINNDMELLRSDIQLSKEEAIKANQRLDDITTNNQ